MQRYLQYIFNQIGGVWAQLDITQRVTIGLMGAILVVGLVALASWGARPSYQILFSNLDPQDAGKIVAKLDEQKVKYQLANGGTTILVPEKSVYSMRLAMANDGLPKAGGGVGFEVFDDFKFGMTDFTQKLNFQRALETELARTIGEISQIRQARVHIAFPDDELYTESKQRTSAAVVLDLAGSGAMTDNQVAGIVNLVASAVKGLKPEDITVVDTNGNLLFHQDPSADGLGFGMGGSKLEVQSKFEKSIEANIQTMLRNVLGPNKSVVRVSAVLNFDSEKTDSEIYEPSDTPIVRSNKTAEETFQGDAEGAGASLGVPQGSPKSNYTKTEETNNYEVTKRIVHSYKSPGAVKKLSVAILLDRAIPKPEQDAILAAASAAAGVDTDRGDVIVVKPMNFDKTLITDAKKEMDKSAQMDMIKMAVQWIGMGIGLIVFIAFIRSGLKKIPLSPPLDSGVSLELSSYAMDKTPRTGIESHLHAIATSRPDEFVRLLRHWLAE